jgi:hypothetical protein
MLHINKYNMIVHGDHNAVFRYRIFHYIENRRKLRPLKKLECRVLNL